MPRSLSELVMAPSGTPRTTPRIEIDLDALVHNLRSIESCAGSGQGIMAVVKDDAYGCGAVPVAQTLQQEGVAWFAVASMHEAELLRKSGIFKPILVLGRCSDDEARRAAAHDIRCTLTDIADLQRWEKLECPLRIHACIDTGMSRLGLFGDEVEHAACTLAGCRHVFLEGLFTHFSSADTPEDDFVSDQMQRFAEARTRFAAYGLVPTVVHVANSAATLRSCAPAFQMVRPGITLYGSNPVSEAKAGPVLRPVARLVSSIVKVKQVPAGTPVSYGQTYITPEETVIATVALGYGNGFPRALGNRGHFLVNGHRMPICGRVTMDYTMIDCGPRSDVQVGDEVVAMGIQNNEWISTDQIARACGTIGYEILCNLSTRIDRFYLRQGRVTRFDPRRYI